VISFTLRSAEAMDLSAFLKKLETVININMVILIPLAHKVGPIETKPNIGFRLFIIG
jgi:hypothetical protein